MGWTSRSGYQRNKGSQHNHGDIKMREDLGNNVGVTTVVGTGKRGNKSNEDRGSSLSRTGSVVALKDPNGWNHSSDNKTTDADSDDYIPSQSDFEVRKTVHITQN